MTHVREVRVTTCFKRSEGNLPVFSKADLAWLVTDSLTKQHAGQLPSEDALPIGAAVSLHRETTEPDILCLAHESRIVLVQLFTFTGEQLHTRHSHDDGDDEVKHPGYTLVCELLKCTSGNDKHPLRNTASADVRVILASLNASELAYLLYKWMDTHVCVQDLELFADKMRAPRNHPAFQSFTLAARILGKDPFNRIRSLKETDYVVYRGKTPLQTSFLAHIEGTLQTAIASYQSSVLLLSELRQSDKVSINLVGSWIVDTRNVPSKLINSMATFTAVEVFLFLDKPKRSQTYLRTDALAGAYDEGREPLHVTVKDYDNRIIEVVNLQYRSRLMQNSRQVQDVVLNVDGLERTYAAKVDDSAGRKSTLRFIGQSAEEAMRYLHIQETKEANGLEENDKGAVKAFLQNVVTSGREDHSAAEMASMKWRRALLLDTKGQQRDVCTTVDLLLPLLFGDPYRPVIDVLDHDTIRFLEKPWLDNFSLISEKERDDRLNPSQSRAARAILSPLTKEPYLEDEGECILVVKKEVQNKDKPRPDQPRNPADRLIIVHGPPGTGKTSLITACCLQFERSCAREAEDAQISKALTRDAVYACCQSNVAVKNIGESLSRGGVHFKIIVSPNFYVDWHEDLYADIKSRLIKSNDLPGNQTALNKMLDGCNVILSTLSFLSSRHLPELLRVRPMRLLMVDEASQIHLRSYPHLLELVGHSVGRVVFLGDDHQLAPFNSEESVEAGISVFELEHLRRNAFLLDTCYRLPAPMAQFISDNVYEGKLKVGPKNLDPPTGLLGCAAFVDVSSGREEKQGTSRKNEKEIDCIVKLFESYKARGGNMSEIKVLTTYDAQREALEKELKKTGLSGDADVVFSVDSFQGRECDHVLLSLVRDGKEIKQNFKRSVTMYELPSLGFLRNERRTNVALTRARRSLTIISNRRFIEEVAVDQLPGLLQIELQFSDPDGGTSYWLEEKDVLKGAVPEALFDLP